MCRTNAFFLISRNYKKGIGSAHKLGLTWGYKKKYPYIITMDCDGTHDPKIIKKMLLKLMKFELVNTNRFIKQDSLSDWPIYRKMLTYTRHYLVKFFLNISYDSSGGFRCYNSKKLKIKHIKLAKDNGYPFFWESIFILSKKKYKISEIPIKLPNRLSGSTKMRLRDIFYSVYYLLKIFIKNLLNVYK